MKSSAGRNLNYRYTISSENFFNDLSPKTQNHRLLKKQQSHAQQIIYDISNLSVDLCKARLNVLLQLEASIYCSAENASSLALFKHQIYVQITDLEDFKKLDQNLLLNMTLVFSPQSKRQAQQLLEIAVSNPNLKCQWQFQNYNPDLRQSLTITDISEILKKNKYTVTDLPFWNSQIANHIELESLEKPLWSFSTDLKNIRLSIVIPTYNNCVFLCNVIEHLLTQSEAPESYEIVIVDDGSTDHTQETLYSLLKNNIRKINIKYIYWSKLSPDRGEQNIFRAGLARNLGVQYTEGQYLFFLDSDMLVPADFVETILHEFNDYDFIQFSRLHIKHSASLKNPRLVQIDYKSQTYIEDEKYWNTLFLTDDWSDLKNYWKYTCTYALGMSKSDFYNCGRFKRHFVSYGFEDTDLGFRMYKMNKKFKLIQKPLLHLTNYSSMQYKNSKFIRDQLLRKTSKLLFLDHLDLEIFETFKFYYQFEKPFVNLIKDVF